MGKTMKRDFTATGERKGKVEIMKHLQGINPSFEDSIFESPYSGLFRDRIDEAPRIGWPTQFQRARGQIELGYALRL